jgi:sulfopyruvate decarboxylase subunit beta
MTHLEALEVLAAARGRQLVITTHGSIDPWVAISDTPLDFSYVPAAMGHGPAFGLGLALAQSQHGVIVVSGDGSLLMNLGFLVTLANHRAEFFLIILDNGVYEVTGGQPTAGAGHTDFAAAARAAGIARVYEFGAAEAWRKSATEALAGPGPVVIWLKVRAQSGQHAPRNARPMKEQIARLRGLLKTGIVAVQLDDPRAAESRKLIDELDAYHINLYPAESNHLLPVEALCQPNVTFLTARVDGLVAGCGAFVNQRGEFAEIKRMYVLPQFRGLKLGRLLLAELENRIRASGLTLACLETGVRQDEALALYEKAGYRRRSAFGEYGEDPLSVFMEKRFGT